MKPPRNLWPVGVTLTLVIFFLGIVGLVVLACSHRNDLVSANYYDDEVLFQKQIDRSSRALQQRSAHVAYDPISRQLFISLPTHTTANKVQGRIRLYRPSEAGLDRELELRVDVAGGQLIDVAELKSGLWRVKVDWTVGGEDYFLDQRVVIPRKS